VQEYRFPLAAMPMTAIDIDLVPGISIKVPVSAWWRTGAGGVTSSNVMRFSLHEMQWDRSALDTGQTV